jgi:hypothetical protein
MGNNVWKVSKQCDDRLFSTRISFDLSENVHLHYRDMRLVFGKEEWKRFASFVAKADDWMTSKEYGENSGKPFQEIEEVIPAKSSYFNGDVALEEQANGLFHLHFHDIRLEFSRPVFGSILNVLTEGGLYNICPLGQLLVIVYDFQQGWVNRPIDQSPIYTSLFDEFSSHDLYMARLTELFPDIPNVVSTKQYDELFKSIVDFGFDLSKEPRVRIDDNCIIDGHHRISILLKMFGPDKRLVFKENQLVGLL